jgi:hypothetical protein
MKKPRQLVELVTEVVLAICLLFIAGTSLFSTFKLNPAELNPADANTVLGQNTSNWSMMQDKNFSSKIVTDNTQLFVSDLVLKTASVTPENKYNVLTVNNYLPRTQKYVLQFLFNKDMYVNYVISAVINGNTTIVYDGQGDHSVKDLKLEVPAETSFIIGLALHSYNQNTSGDLGLRLQISSLTLGN